MPPPRLPFPDPATPLTQAIVNVAGCYPKNAAITALAAAATCKGADQGDLQALLSLVIAAALCAARNEETDCCSADPFEVNNLLVANNWTTQDLTVHGNATVLGDAHVNGTLCIPRPFQPRSLNNSLILAIDNVGCLKYFPKSDLDPFSLHLGGNLIVDGATQFFTLHEEDDATFGSDWNVAGDLNIGGKICVDGLPETTWSDNAHLVFVRGTGCLKKGPAGICCQTVIGCCPPFTFDPDGIGYPDPIIFPALNPPPGANTHCEIPLYALAALPFPPTGWAKTEIMVTSGLMVDSGYPPGTSFGIVYQDNKPAPAPISPLYYNNGTASWQTTLPNFADDGNVTFVEVLWFALGYVALAGSTEPGHEYLKPLYDGGTFDVNHLCPGDS